MVSETIIDINNIDLKKEVCSKKDILELNPQRYEFEQLDKVVHLDLDENIAVGVKYQKKDEFWVRGHVEGRPLMPGVLMVEMAAQLSSVLFHKKFDTKGKVFFGFAGVNNVKFRGVVDPDSEYVMTAKALRIKPRIAVIKAQGYVEGKLVFEGEVTGAVVG